MIAHRLAASRGSGSKQETLTGDDVAATSIVIVGFGRIGRRVGEILEIRNVPYVAVDNDARVVMQERKLGRSVFFGDARQPGVLKSLDVGEAGLVIVTVDDFQAAEQVVSSLHRTFPELEILASGHNMQHCQTLRSEGAGLVVSENLEASIALAQAALTKIEGEGVENDVAIDQFRSAYYADTEKRGANRSDKFV